MTPVYQGIGGPFGTGGFDTSFAALLHNGYPPVNSGMNGLHQMSHQSNLFSPTGLLNSAFSPKGYYQGGINNFLVSTPSHNDPHRSARRHPKDSSSKKFLSLGVYGQPSNPFGRFSPTAHGMESPMAQHPQGLQNQMLAHSIFGGLSKVVEQHVKQQGNSPFGYRGTTHNGSDGSPPSTMHRHQY